MKTKQPQWRYVANLGDASPLDYGGAFVLTDDTGTYPPEIVLLERVTQNDCEEDNDRYELRRIVCDRCTNKNGVLSDNSFHPASPAWFAEDLSAVAQSVGIEPSNLSRRLCSNCAVERATAYLDLANYHGADNFDDYPLQLSRADAKSQLAKIGFPS